MGWSDRGGFKGPIIWSRLEFGFTWLSSLWCGGPIGKGLRGRLSEYVDFAQYTWILIRRRGFWLFSDVLKRWSDREGLLKHTHAHYRDTIIFIQRAHTRTHTHTHAHTHTHTHTHTTYSRTTYSHTYTWHKYVHRTPLYIHKWHDNYINTNIHVYIYGLARNAFLASAHIELLSQACTE